MSEWHKYLTRCLLPLNPIPSGGHNWAGIAAIITSSKEALLVKRAVRPGDPWSGDWAMPGGRWRDGDTNLYECIRREVLEETSIDISMLEALGWLPERSPRVRPELKIMPLVLLTNSRLSVILNDELTDYCWASLQKLVYEKRVVNTPRGEILTDVYLLSGGEFVWGLTARIIQEITNCIQL
ncbi:MAG: NUDIX domain-containing protein [Nitrososphaerota archaeon]